MESNFLHIQLDKTAQKSLFRQIYAKIRDDILTQKLAAGSRLPASRELAKSLGISRNVVMEAYGQLQAEGYLTSRAGSYTRVAEDTWYKEYQKPGTAQFNIRVPEKKIDISFETGLPDLKNFPAEAWGRYLRQAAANATIHELAYYRPSGHPKLRQVLSQYLYKQRGISVDPEHIVITSGATQALFLTAKILHAENCDAVIEDPGGYGVVQILENAGFRMNPASADKKGLTLDSIDLTPDTRLVYVTPSHQFPMGHIMPVATRIGLLKLLEDRDIFIVEDDYDSEFRYEGAPIHPLKALNPGKVIYIGSFSKTLSPALRLGFAVLPEKLLNAFKTAKRFSDAQSPMIDQIALENFISDGQLERHIFKMKKGYRKKRDTLIKVLKEQFGDALEIYGENAGLHIAARFSGTRFRPDSSFNVCHNQILIPSVEKHCIRKGLYNDMLVFGYGNLSINRIITGIRQLNQFNQVNTESFKP